MDHNEEIHVTNYINSSLLPDVVAGQLNLFCTLSIFQETEQYSCVLLAL